MKKFITTCIIAVFLAAVTVLSAQNSQENYLGLPGDNLNLYAVLKLFQESKTLEEFERNLNDQKSTINNLDLNGDNLVDYIKVYDDVDGDVHNIVLQVSVGPKENQDVAVITVQRMANGQVLIQLTGDEELYGKNYIIEPRYDDSYYGETPNPGYSGDQNVVTTRNITVVRTTPYEIASWPLVSYMYMPTYSVWRSAWYWGYYPRYWHAWRPFYWHYYYGYHYHWYNDYYSHYQRWEHHRYERWNDFYYSGRRSFSPDVNHRIEVGTYRKTYSRPHEMKKGEKMFARTNPDVYKRSIANSPDRSVSRRNDVRMNTPNNNASDSRRNTNVGNTRSVNGRDNGMNNSNVRTRSTSVNRSVDNNRNGNNATRNVDVNTTRTVSPSDNGSVNVNTRRSGTVETNRSSGNTTRTRSSETNRQVERSNNVRSSERKSERAAQKKEVRSSETKKNDTQNNDSGNRRSRNIN